MHPLFLASSVFPWCPSSCPLHYRKAFGYYDTAALCPACWHSRTSARVMQFQSSLIPTENVLAPRSCLLYAGWSCEAVLNTDLLAEATTLPFWPWRHSQFRHFPLTTLQTQVSLVSIGHRIRSLSAFWLADWGLCQWASHPQQCHCWTQATLSSYHCLNMALHEQHFLPLEGAQVPAGPRA